MKTDRKIWVYVNKQDKGDPLSLMMTTGNDMFISNSDKLNKSNIVNDLNMLCVSGDKNYVSKYMIDWLISMSNGVINSNIISIGDTHDVVNITKSLPIKMFGNSKTDDLELLNKTVIDLLSFSENVRMIPMTKNGGVVLEDDFGKTMIGTGMTDLNHHIIIKEREKAQINK